MPKKSDLLLTKCTGKISLVSFGDEPLFFQEDNDKWIPCLRLLHKSTKCFFAHLFLVPIDILTRVQVDSGAIKFILQGADIMSPGLTSAGGSLPDNLTKGQIVLVYAEGKEHALCIGRMLLSSEEVKSVNSGHAITNLHCLCDGLWKIDRIKH